MSDYTSQYSGENIDSRLTKVQILESGLNDVTQRLGSAETEISKKQNAVPGKGLSTNDYTTPEKNKLAGLKTQSQIDAAINAKQDKVSGKGLSTNDYTNAEKTKLGGLPTAAQLDSTLSGKQDTISDLGAIRSGAEKGESAYQKPISGIPRSDMALDVMASLNKADTAVQQVSGKGLSTNDYTNAEKTKLGNLPSAETLQHELDNKQDKIDDLDTIRQNARDAYKKPSDGIPKTDMDTATQRAIDRGAVAYIKPSDGIPKSDLDPNANISLSKADTAYQRPQGGIPMEHLSEGVQAAIYTGGSIEVDIDNDTLVFN